MTKKLPKVYKASDNIKAVNESWYSSYIKREDDSSQNVLENSVNDFNFFSFFNKNVTIILKNNEIINTKILSKYDSKILIKDGRFIDIKDIKDIS